MWAFGVLLTLGLAQATKFINPIRENGPDPYITFDQDTSKYYLLTTVQESLDITAASTIQGLHDHADRRTVFSNQTMKDKGEVWAPEIHKIDGIWYLYYSWLSLPHVLKGGPDPFGPYSSPKQLTPDYGIDGTVLTVASQNYFVYSCLREYPDLSKKTQSICISKLTNGDSIDLGKISVIARPDQPWEQHGDNIYFVNEGPAPMYWDNQVYLTYSTSFCGSAEYNLGLLHLTGQDPLDPASWTKKTDGPIFQSGNGEFGTGHNSIFISPDKSELWQVYHAVTSPKGACDSTRATYVQKIDVSNFGTVGPVFGKPAGVESEFEGPSGEDKAVQPKPDDNKDKPANSPPILTTGKNCKREIRTRKNRLEGLSEFY